MWLGANNRSSAGAVLGVHGYKAQLDGFGTSPCSVTISSAAAGSTFVLLCCADLGNIATPTDNKGNTYTQRGSDQGYAGGQYPGFGLRTYAVTSGSGGTSHTIQTVKGITNEELSLCFVEIIKGSVVQAATQSSAAATGLGVGYSSPSVTTTGPAVILALWGGDGGTNFTDQSVSVAGPWSLIEYSFIGSTAYIQFAVAYYNAPRAGTYSCYWTPTQDQGAAMSMIAIQ